MIDYSIVLKPVTHSIPSTRYPAPMIQSAYSLGPPHIFCYLPRTNLLIGGHLRTAFYKLGRSADNEGCESACCAGAPDLGEGDGKGGGFMEEGKSSVVGYEEQGIEGSIANNRRCAAYARAVGSACLS
jgi:hypothetical protein